MPKDRPSLNPLLHWLWDLLSFYSNEEIKVPTEFHDQVYNVKNILTSDTSGIVNSMLDYAINSACVDFNVDTDNANFKTIIEEWFDLINLGLLGRVPVGLKPLAKEYYRERWKNSSLIVLRTVWSTVKVGGQELELPVKMWIVDGGNIDVQDKGDMRTIGSEKYFLRLSEKEHKAIPATRDEMIFVQKPFSSWSHLYPTPFLIERGLWKNLMFYNLVNKKSERIVGKALEYLLALKKGTEQLAVQGSPNFIYGEEDLRKVKEDFKTHIQDNKTEAGTPTYVTNFDTQFEHIIPEYKKALDKELYTGFEKRLLGGLGLIEIVEGIASTRREAILNPKPFVREIETGIQDFTNLLSDVMRVIVLKNKAAHPKFFSNKIRLHYNPIKDFINDNIREHMRSMYDRGVLSKQTYTEVVGGADIDIEVTRRKNETSNELDKVMYPPVVQNLEQYANDADGKLKPLIPQPKPAIVQPNKDNIPTSKQGIEKKNFKGTEEEGEVVYEEAPYKTTSDLPDNVKNVLPPEAQKVYMDVFNQSYPKGEDYARKVAWFVVKKTFKKVGDKWVKKTKTKGSEGEFIDLENSSVDETIDRLVKLAELEIVENKNKLLRKLVGSENEDL